MGQGLRHSRREQLPLDVAAAHEVGLAALPASFSQIHCSAPLDVLLERYGERERHPGHVDSERIAALRDAVETGRHDPLDLPGRTIRVETSGDVDIAALDESVGALIR